jgi:hypothetical protein
VPTDSEDNPIPAGSALSTETAGAKIEEYRQRIWSSCQKTVEDLINLGAVCRAAADELSESGVETLLHSDMPINESTFWKYVKIGRDQRLPGIAANLPSRLTTMYEVTHLTEEQFEQAVASHKIHPKVRREDIAALRKPSSSGGGKDDQLEEQSPKPPAIKIEAGRRYELEIPESARAEDCAYIAQALGKMRQEFGMGVNPIEGTGLMPAGAPVLATPSGSVTSRVKQTSNPRVHSFKGSTSLSSAGQK